MLLVTQLAYGGIIAASVTYPTLDPNNKQAGSTLSGGNLIHTAHAGAAYITGVFATVAKPATEKVYFEITINIVGNSLVGISNASGFNGTSGTNAIYNDATTFAYANGGTKANSGSDTAYGNSYTSGDVIGVAFDGPGGKVWFAKNGTWQASGDPAAGTNAAFTGLTGQKFATVMGYNSAQHTINFGATAFAHAAPSGFSSYTA